MSATDHDLCLYIVHKYMLDQPQVFSIVAPPSYGVSKTHGPDLVAENRCMNVLDYIEVELDATNTEKFKKIAKRARELRKKYDRPVRIWLISSSDKWVRGVEEKIKELDEIEARNITARRISAIHVGERKFPF